MIDTLGYSTHLDPTFDVICHLFSLGLKRPKSSSVGLKSNAMSAEMCSGGLTFVLPVITGDNEWILNKTHALLP